MIKWCRICKIAYDDSYFFNPADGFQKERRTCPLCDSNDLVLHLKKRIEIINNLIGELRNEN